MAEKGKDVLKLETGDVVRLSGGDDLALIFTPMKDKDLKVSYHALIIRPVQMGPGQKLMPETNRHLGLGPNNTYRLDPKVLPIGFLAIRSLGEGQADYLGNLVGVKQYEEQIRPQFYKDVTSHAQRISQKAPASHKDPLARKKEISGRRPTKGKHLVLDLLVRDTKGLDLLYPGQAEFILGVAGRKKDIRLSEIFTCVCQNEKYDSAVKAETQRLLREENLSLEAAKERGYLPDNSALL